MKNNVPNVKILSKYKKYKPFSVNLKALTFTGILLLICLIWIIFREPINNSDQNIDINNPENKSNYEIKILNSTFNGVNKNLYPYQINTTQAIKTFDNSYLLDKVVAKYKINKDEELVITAKNAILNEETQILKLKNNVELFLGESILKIQEVDLNLLNQNAFSDSEVILFFKNSKLKANNFSSNDDNMIINFKGQVTTVIDISDF